MDNAKFRKPVVPGDTLEVEVELLRLRGNMGKVKCVARVGGEEAAEAEIMFALVMPLPPASAAAL